jgi:hypothetical protein
MYLHLHICSDNDSSTNGNHDLINLLTTCILLSLSTGDKNAALGITEMVAYLGTYAVNTNICTYIGIYTCK